MEQRVILKCLRQRPLASAIATGCVISPAAFAGSFAISKTLDAPVSNSAWVGNSSSPYGRGINNNSFQTGALTTYNGYQYTAFWRNESNVGRVTVGRRAVGSSTWELANISSVFVNGANDAHNVISLGLNPTDGTIHLAYDLHGHNLRYRVSNQNLLANPSGVPWNSNLFSSSERNWLVASGQTVTGVTYPMFVNTPDDNLQYFYRNGSSGNGSWLMYDYTGSTHAWGNGHQIDNGSTGTYFGTVTQGDANRNNYPNGFTYDANGRLHSVFTWREGATGAANHDLMYVYSDDRGTTWKNNAGTVVANQATGLRFNLNSPGLIVRSLNESQTLMNQQGQNVDNANHIHSVGWHRDSSKDPSTSTATPWEPQESSYFHNWRDDAGNWHETRLDGNVGARPKVFFDDDDNAVMIYTVKSGGGPLTGGTGNNLYFTNGDLVIATATKGSNWTDWKINHVESGPFISEAQADENLFRDTGVLSVIMQNSPTLTGNQGTAMRVLDYDLSFAAPATRTFTATEANFDDAANWNGAVPELNTVVTINGGRTARVTSTHSLDNRVLVGSGGTAGTLVVESGSLDLLHAGLIGSVYGGSIVVGADAGSVGTYTQTGGTVSAWRFAVGDYASTTSGGGVSSATLADGSLTTYALEVGFSANASSSGSSMTVTGGTLNVNGDIVLGEFGNAALLDLSGGSTTVAGDIREGFNKTNVGTLRFTGGSLDMTGGSITLDNVEFNSGTLSNLAAFNNGAAINKNSAGVMTFAGSNTFSNAITITSGSLRAASGSALGSNAVGTTIAGGISNGRLELVNDISLTEPIVLAGRQPGSAGDAHLVNISGNNVISSILNTTVGGNQYGIQSDAGLLTINGSFANNQTSGDVRFLNLMGDGDGRFNGVIADNGQLTNPSLTSVVKTGNGTWTLAGNNSFTAPLTVQAGTLALKSSSWNVLSSAGGVDVAGGKLVFDYAGSSSPAATILSLLTTAHGNGFSSGQIRSSTATSARGLGWVDNGSAFTVAVALYGDANLSGTVDFDDLLALAQSYGSASGATWSAGDSNYDGAINFDDLLALAQNYSQSLSLDVTSFLPDASFAADWRLALSLVPEPGLFGVGALAMTLLGRRRLPIQMTT
jgi:autotransporter-associated beta strand protein